MRTGTLICLLVIGRCSFVNPDDESNRPFSSTRCTHPVADSLDMTAIFGAWDWLSSSGGLAGSTFTPENTGDTARASFRANCKFELVQNESVLVQAQFVITAQGDTVLNRVQPDSSLVPLFGIRFASADVLVLTDPCVDCFTHAFQRNRSVR